MLWLLLCASGLLIALILFQFWRRWIAPWNELEELAHHLGRGEQPRTFLIGGNTAVQRVGVALEDVFHRQAELEKQIAKRESGAQAIFSAMHDALLVVDSERRCVLANETFRKLFGLAESARGTPLLELVRDPALDVLIAEALDRGEARRKEVTLGPRQFEVNAVPTKNDTGKISGAVVLFHDISELKRTDEIRRDFVANVSHELRTPLSILRGYIETLLDYPNVPRGEARSILETMERHSKRLGLLADDLLTIAQLESGRTQLQRSMVDLPSLLDTVVGDWQKRCDQKRLRLITNTSSDLPQLSADESRLREVLDNLIDNAVKYSAEGGEIDLGAQRRDNQLILTVTDGGSGISQEDLPRIFERFYRADKARSRELGGTGLGLSIVKHIAQLHGGRVEAESELGQGTTIRVIFPLNS